MESKRKDSARCAMVQNGEQEEGQCQMRGKQRALFCSPQLATQMHEELSFSCALMRASALRKEKEAARLAAEERQQQREKARDVKEAHCAPQKVSFMSKRHTVPHRRLATQRGIPCSTVPHKRGLVKEAHRAPLCPSKGELHAEEAYCAPRKLSYSKRHTVPHCAPQKVSCISKRHSVPHRGRALCGRHIKRGGLGNFGKGEEGGP
eukprot:1162147-Pelagomonas_calceolata.AAC.4